MKTMKIKWDESMAIRCLAKYRDVAFQYEEDNKKPVGKTTDDMQWEDFEKALNKALISKV